MRRVRQFMFCALLLACLFTGNYTQTAAQAPGPIYVAQAQGIITSVTGGYLERALHLAEAANASVLVIQLSSTGAVLRDVRPLASKIVAAHVPVVVYVTPAGTDSGAAGTLLLSAAHISALAPDTSFGSPLPLNQVDTALSQQTRDLLLDSVTSELRSWNAARGRNTAWLDQAVRAGIVLNNEQASSMQPPAVDLVAANLDELLTLLNNRQVKLSDGRTVQLATLGRNVTSVNPTVWESVRLTLSDPTIAFILLVLGALALCLEFAVPGTSVFAGIGVVLLLAAGLGLIALPLNWWAVVLLVFALAFIGAEVIVYSHGALAVVGLALLIFSALNLIDSTQAPGVLVALWVIALAGLAVVTVVAFGIWLVLRSRAQPETTGQAAMIGKLAEVRSRLDPTGMVFVEGALWQAISEAGSAEVGDWVRVIALHELRLIVRPLDDDQADRE